MDIHEHDTVILTVALEGDNLQPGDVGTVVHVHGSGEAFEVEFISLTGRTVAIATVRRDQLRSTAPNDLLHSRPVT